MSKQTTKTSQIRANSKSEDSDMSILVPIPNTKRSYRMAVEPAMSRADHKVSDSDQEMQFALDRDDDAIDQLFGSDDENENPPEDSWLAQ